MCRYAVCMCRYLCEKVYFSIAWSIAPCTSRTELQLLIAFTDSVALNWSVIDDLGSYYASVWSPSNYRKFAIQQPFLQPIHCLYKQTTAEIYLNHAYLALFNSSYGRNGHESMEFWLWIADTWPSHIYTFATQTKAFYTQDYLQQRWYRSMVSIPRQKTAGSHRYPL